MHINQRLCDKSKGFPLMIALAVFAALAFAAQATAQHIITFDPPGAGTTAGLGTQTPGINQSGVVTGFYAGSDFVAHGFVRTPDGAITTFDAPGAGTMTVAGFAGTPAGLLWGQGTYAYSINEEGAIAGFYADDSNVYHGFVRSPNGQFTTFDAPNAASGAGQGTTAANIDPSGTIFGYYVDASNVAHGYVRAPNGQITTFDAPGAGIGAGQGTYAGAASSINPSGAVAGTYYDSTGASHAYVRHSTGVITTFDAPGAGSAPGQGTNSWSINPSGSVTANYIDSTGVNHGFVRTGNGKLSTFDAPGAGSAPSQGTVGEGINATGVVVGNYYDSSGVNHGYVRTEDGRITTYDVPGAGSGPGQGTIPLTDNPAGTTTGVYTDANGALHGFVWMPK